jgi:prepilin-type N-terminal cleavage/methylation domain-containing protein/prepilin-type processing-associated H-X9-DG protein
MGIFLCPAAAVESSWKAASHWTWQNGRGSFSHASSFHRSQAMNPLRFRRPSRLRAFTLVELLVVITIIGMLMALILPAVHSAVGRANQTHCSNNMRQVALALNCRTTFNGRFPGYQQEMAGRVVPWPVVILGEVERYDLLRDWQDPDIADQDLARPVLPVFQCPSDPLLRRGTPSISFVGNAGTPDAEKEANGVMLDGRGASVTAILDGRSNTLLLSENIQATRWDQAGKQATVFVWHPTTSPRAEHHINRGIDLPLSPHTARPSSHHVGGVNVSFCDTHTRYLRETIDYKVYMQLMTTDGKNSDMPAEWKSYQLNSADYE